jgi:secreted Zn-dependent insulinase-like peptidase
MRTYADVCSLTLTVQSSLRDVTYLTDKVFAFVKGFEGELERMEEEQVTYADVC